MESSKENPLPGRIRAISDDPELRDRLPAETVTREATRPEITLDRMIDAYLSGYGDRPALGERDYRIAVNPVDSSQRREYREEFRTYTYAEVRTASRALATSLQKHPALHLGSGEFLPILGFASVDYGILDLSCGYSGVIPVPLSARSPAGDLKDILNQTKARAIAASVRDLDQTVPLIAACETITTLIVFDYDAEVTSERQTFLRAQETLRTPGRSVSVVPIKSLLLWGEQIPFTFLPEGGAGPEDTALLIHTSGSTGRPKGACILAKALMNTWEPKDGPPIPKVTLVIAPFHHMMGRDAMIFTLGAGGTAFFTLMPDMSTLLRDLQIVRPTSLGCFPRVCEMIYQHIQLAIQREMQERGASHEEAILAVKETLARTLIGDRVTSITVASAPIRPEIREFLADFFNLPIDLGYSSTETSSGGLAMNGTLNRTSVLEYKLRDVPELGYFTTDSPYPRGELCVKTKFGIREYFQNPEATNALFDEEGFCQTGDIVEERGENQIEIIDRKKDILKLSQGEFVAVGQLAKTFESGSPYIHQVYLYGNRFRSYLLGVVVPEWPLIEERCGKNPTDEELRQFLHQEFLKVGNRENLKNFEIPRDFLIERIPFSQENGLLSSVNKYLRAEMKARYADRLETLYQEHDEAQMQASGEASAPSGSIEAQLAQLLRVNLGVSSIPGDQSLSFRDLGGDSLGAALLSLEIEKTFAVSIGGDEILDPRGSLKKWAEAIRSAKERPSAQSLEAIHRPKHNRLAASDFRSLSFESEPLPQTPPAPLSEPSPETILLTGASGYLGGRVCLQWLEKCHHSGGQVICLVRAGSHREALERIQKRFAEGDPKIRERFAFLARQHLKAIPGDLSEPRLGLAHADYEHLAHRVTRIVHCAALVNHRLAYLHLFRPNVLGTLEVIRLATSNHPKPIDFISTIGVHSLPRTEAQFGSSENPSEGIELRDDYASGYFASKWAGEQLLKAANARHALPVNIYRSGLVLPDTQFRGQVNRDDILTRLIFSIIRTGTAPQSFYASGVKSVPFDGIPLDIAADLITSLPNEPDQGLRLIEAPSLAPNGHPYDRIIEWIESFGYSIERIRDYHGWWNSLANALSELPEEEQRDSLIPVLEAYRNPIHPGIDTARGECSIHLPETAKSPFFTEDYIHHCVRDIVSLCNLPPPKTAPA
ncbi:MAG: non-ribosomal peptide synthetase [Puniceicoccales bacterium]